jgi:hypothetical protein
MKHRPFAAPATWVLVVAFTFVPLLLFAQSGKGKGKSNLGLGLHELVQRHQQALSSGTSVSPTNIERSVLPSQPSGVFRVQVDSANRVLVNVHLAPGASVEAVKKQLTDNGASVVAQDLSYRNGVVAAYVPVGAAESIGAATGVSAVNLAHRPITNVGKTTSQAASILRTDVANAAGIDGRGVTVGLLSDSFNTARFFGVTDTALTDVQSGDLPNTTAIPNGEGLKFLIEADPAIFGPQTDEGRGMAQLVHDLAPGAGLCFATALGGEVNFANNIRALRTNPACNADVIADDIIYLGEPMFSDGIVAQAVNEVATSETLPGHKVSYFSSANNQGGEGYTSNFHFVADAAARALPAAAIKGVKLNTIPASIDTSGGFHNFNARGAVQIVQDLTFGRNTTLIFQWDDPFDAGGITSDFNLLLFSASTGNFLASFGDDNFATDEPIEGFTATGRFLMVIARTSKGTHQASRLKYVAFGSVVDADGHITPDTPTIYGHTAAQHANSVAAMRYNADPAFFTAPAFGPLYESFSNPGPVTIAFDANGKRLAKPEIRLKPDIAAPDGTNTTFFPEELLFGPGQDFEAAFGLPDGFPNFFGTSAAAPHAAAVGALIVQRKGGPGSVKPEEVAKILKQSAPERDARISSSFAAAEGHDTAIVVSANGNDQASASTTFFTVSFASKNPGQTLDQLTIDLSAIGMLFNPNVPFTVGASTGPKVVSVTPNALTSTITITFSGFTSGNAISFGENRDFAKGDGTSAGFGNSADSLAGGSIVAVLSQVASNRGRGKNNNDNVLSGEFVNPTAKDFFSIFDGFGMPDAARAVRVN